MSTEPSDTDEKTFQRVFGGCDWAVMMIAGTDRSAYCRLRFNVGPGGQVQIPVQIDYNGSFDGTDHEAWDAEYAANVEVVKRPLVSEDANDFADTGFNDDRAAEEFMEQFLDLYPEERQAVLDELANEPDSWDQEGEVVLL